ncbi:MAG: polysaccharide deacetylase family protein [Oligoflexales bacterium]|nr:polysaccharide deacetylase family protein [Oligoflexales bacterium]
MPLHTSFRYAIKAIFLKDNVLTNRSKDNKRILITAYHRVGEPQKGARYRGMFVTPGILACHIKWLFFLGYKFTTVSGAFMDGVDGRVACITFDDGYLDNYEQAFPVLRELGVSATVFVVTSDVGKRNHVFREAGEKSPSDLMDWQHLKSLKEAGWEIGSHASEHVHLDRYGGERQRELVSVSQEALILNLGERANSFAYPYGAYNSNTLDALSEAGFRFGLTIREGLNGPNVNPLELRRSCLKGYRWIHRFLPLGISGVFGA